jgi:hypothetical protein
MSKQLSKLITDAVAQNLLQYKFCERHDDTTENIAGIVKTSWNMSRRVFGGHGIVAIILVPETVTDSQRLKTFFRDIRREVNSEFVGFAAYKSSHSFVVLVCPHDLFTSCFGIASKLKDKTGLHMNIVQGVILVDSQTGEVEADYTRPAQHKDEYNAVLSAVSDSLK